ncbi:hypothetical protein VD0002_g3383 [Verticillium dahliae]|uniref:Extracellular membrane protein CFEM domain-containing protein n=1 Tax=Verticillium dahliae TaxID=27337 RepID=A0AA45AQC7_VERDA|nr:Cell wall mannoprotein CIS3 [Verticillium dahliae VDG2]PNH35201.1 hypothetical protein BJF96_g1919 [Verticillium dahliae]PNH41375.1 hypothetical protein VD0004_g5757 [Verticillium dahliae]PNH54377.1 hypothetical protein VD0003_g3152 [Verticillium dahliae]PNH65732.1 hypothetical protein VD0002_g3383 [Verticillium dahliae]
MKFSATILAVAATTLVSTVSAQFPLCAAQTCTEANMFLCFCKSTFLALAYRDCACQECPSTATAVSAVQYGLDICTQAGAPISWLPAQCF